MWGTGSTVALRDRVPVDDRGGMVVVRVLLVAALAALPGTTPADPDRLGVVATAEPGGSVHPAGIGAAAVASTTGGVAVRAVPGPGGAGSALQLAPRGQAPTVLVVRGGGTVGGRGPLTLVADVRRDPGPDEDGDNVAQRGLWESGGQVKLQLDGGVPSCVVAGSDGRVVAADDAPVVPGVWYRLICSRVDGVVTLVVHRLDTGERTTARAVGDLGAVVLPAAVPLSVGGKVNPGGRLVTGPDPFAGAVAGVELRTTS